MNIRWSNVVIWGLLAATPAVIVSAHDLDAPGMEAREHREASGRMKKELGLTDDQSAKLKSIRESEKTALQPLVEKQRELRRKLKDQVKNKAKDDEIKITLDEIKANRAAIQEQREPFKKQREAVLTPTQQAQMLEHREKHMRHKDGPEK